MTNLIDFKEGLLELENYLRSADVLTTTQRGVTRTTATGTFAGETSLIINVANVKNIKSVVVASVTLNYGADYTINKDYDNSGTVACRIAFTSAQTGAYTITYDYGSTDKIWADFVQETLRLSQYPRVSIQLSPSSSRPGGFGNINETQIYVSIAVYDDDQFDVLDVQKNIAGAMIDHFKSFYYFKGPFFRVNVGSPKPSPWEEGKNKILMSVNEYRSLFNYEKN